MSSTNSGAGAAAAAPTPEQAERLRGIILTWFMKHVYSEFQRSLAKLDEALIAWGGTNVDAVLAAEKKELEFRNEAKSDGVFLRVLVPCWRQPAPTVTPVSPINAGVSVKKQDDKENKEKDYYMNAPALTFSLLNKANVKAKLEDIKNDVEALLNKVDAKVRQKALASVNLVSDTPPFLRPLLAIAHMTLSSTASASSALFALPTLTAGASPSSTPSSSLSGSVTATSTATQTPTATAGAESAGGDSKLLLHFARASMPPDLCGLLAPMVAPSASALWPKWSALLSAEPYGLHELLKGMRDRDDKGALQGLAAECFLAALEVGPQLVNRGTLLNVEGIDTANQRFLADIQVQTLSVLHNDSLWQWRDRLDLKDDSSVTSLLPKHWPRRNNELSLKDPLLYTLRTNFNKMVIGENTPVERWSTCAEASEENLKQFRLVPALLLARMVPEAAGDPFTAAGRESISKRYQLVALNQRKEATYDCLMNLADFPGDHQTLCVDFSYTWESRFGVFLHHQSTDYDKAGVSLFAHWAALGPGYEDRVEGPRWELEVLRAAECLVEEVKDRHQNVERYVVALRVGEGGVSAILPGMRVRAQGLQDDVWTVDKVNKDAHKVVLKARTGNMTSPLPTFIGEVVVYFYAEDGAAPAHSSTPLERHDFVRHADCNSVWHVDTDSGERSGDMLGVDWLACNASQEWEQPLVMEDKRRQVFLSDPVHSRSGMTYSHQAFAFTLSRKKEHYLLNIFLPFFVLTSSVMVVYPVYHGDINTRATLLVGFFFAHLSLRFVTAQYLPRISYSTQLDLYIQLCLLFVLLATVFAMVSYKNLPTGLNLPSGDLASDTFSLSGTSIVRLSPASAPVPAGGGFPGLSLLDDWLWALWGLLWLCVNFYFSQFFLGKYAAASEARAEKTHKRMGRSTTTTRTAAPPPATLVAAPAVPAIFEWTCLSLQLPRRFAVHCTALRLSLHDNFCGPNVNTACFVRAQHVLSQALLGLLALAALPLRIIDAFFCCGSCSRCLSQSCHISTGLSLHQWVGVRLGCRSLARCCEGLAASACPNFFLKRKCQCVRRCLGVDKPLPPPDIEVGLAKIYKPGTD